MAISGDFPPRLVLAENGLKILTATALPTCLGGESGLLRIAVRFPPATGDISRLDLRRRKALLGAVQCWKLAYVRIALAQILALAIRDAGPHTATNQQEDAGGRCDR